MVRHLGPPAQGTPDRYPPPHHPASQLGPPAQGTHTQKEKASTQNTSDSTIRPSVEAAQRTQASHQLLAARAGGQEGVASAGLVEEPTKRKKALDCLVALSVRQELAGSSTFAAMARLRPTAAGSP